MRDLGLPSLGALASALRGKSLLVILPALNEAESIRAVLARIPRSFPGVSSVEILVVDDGSTDETAKLCRDAGASVISHGRNLGVGAAMQTGLDEAVRRRVDYAVNIDADGQFRPEDIATLLQPLLDGKADFASASRFKDPRLVPDMPAVKRLGNWGMAAIISTINGERFHDVSCGFRAYSRETMLQLVLSGSFTYTQETFLLLGQRGLRIAEVPLEVRGVREIGQSRVASNLFRYGWRTSGIIFSCVRDYSPGSVFNAVALFLGALATALSAFFFWHRFRTGAFSPHLWAGFMAAFFYGLSFTTFALGQIAAMVARVRKLQEKQLYILRKRLERIEDEK